MVDLSWPLIDCLRHGQVDARLQRWDKNVEEVLTSKETHAINSKYHERGGLACNQKIFEALLLVLQLLFAFHVLVLETQRDLIGKNAHPANKSKYLKMINC